MEPKLPPRDPDPEPPGFPPVPLPNPDEPGPDVFPKIEPDPPQPQRLRNSLTIALALVFAVLLPGCQTESQREAARRRAEQDRNSISFQAGEAAHKIAKEAAKAGAEAARKLDESARKAHEGWQAQERKDREKSH